MVFWGRRDFPYARKEREVKEGDERIETSE
jgi:hypothetical protein